MSSRSILTLMSKVLGAEFAGETWDGWRVLLKAIFALDLTDAELETFEELTGRSTAPTVLAREVWAIVGRRGGKSIIAALVAVYLTTCRTYKLARGEVGTFMVIAADRRQARVVRRYISGLLHSTPVLEQLIAHETKTEIQLTNGLSIEIHSASFRSVRGYTVVGAILDEIGFGRRTTQRIRTARSSPLCAPRWPPCRGRCCYACRAPTPAKASFNGHTVTTTASTVTCW